MTTAETEQVITDVFNKINAGSYFRSTTEIQSAARQANIQLYQRFRGNMAQYQKNSPKAVLNFGETTITLDSLLELFRRITLTVAPLTVALAGEVVDIVETIDLRFSTNPDDPFHGAKILPANQQTAMLNNSVLPAAEKYPYAFPVNSTAIPDQYQVFEIWPNTPRQFDRAIVSAYVMPKTPVFTLTESGGAIPTITVTVPFTWTSEKIPALVNLMIQNLGFTLQNGVLIQGSAAQLQDQL